MARLLGPATKPILRSKKAETAAMHEALQSDYRTTIEAFHAFVDDRPDDEKWELIDGEIVLNPTPTNRHEIVVHNLEVELELQRRRLKASWQIHGGIGTRHRGDQHNEPVPDLMIVPKPTAVANWTYDALVVFEVLSPYSVRRDMVRKRAFYREIDGLTHYIVVAQDRREATLFSRADGFEPKILNAADATIEIEPLGISIPLADVYRDIPLG